MLIVIRSYLGITWDLADGYAAEYQGMKECRHAVLEIDCLDLPLEIDPNESTHWLGRPVSYAYRGIIEPWIVTSMYVMSRLAAYYPPIVIINIHKINLGLRNHLYLH